MDGNASEGHRLAAAGVLGVEGRGREGRRQDVGPQEAKHADAARRHGEGVVGLIVGRADDAGPDAAIRAEEELERGDRERAVRLRDGVVTQRGAGTGGHAQRIRIGADVASGSVTGDRDGFAADET